jgi:hypothetical protein
VTCQNCGGIIVVGEGPKCTACVQRSRSAESFLGAVEQWRAKCERCGHDTLGCSLFKIENPQQWAISHPTEAGAVPVIPR